jgi:hypothetical protein
LEYCNGVVGGEIGAAQLLGIPRTTLQYRMKKLGIHNDSLKQPKGASPPQTGSFEVGMT